MTLSIMYVRGTIQDFKNWGVLCQKLHQNERIKTFYGIFNFRTSCNFRNCKGPPSTQGRPHLTISDQLENGRNGSEMVGMVGLVGNGRKRSEKVGPGCWGDLFL